MQHIGPFYGLSKVRLTEETTDFKILIAVWESRTGSCDYSYMTSSFSGKFQAISRCLFVMNHLAIAKNTPLLLDLQSEIATEIVAVFKQHNLGPRKITEGNYQIATQVCVTLDGHKPFHYCKGRESEISFLFKSCLSGTYLKNKTFLKSTQITKATSFNILENIVGRGQESFSYILNWIAYIMI